MLRQNQLLTLGESETCRASPWSVAHVWVVTFFGTVKSDAQFGMFNKEVGSSVAEQVITGIPRVDKRIEKKRQIEGYLLVHTFLRLSPFPADAESLPEWSVLVKEGMHSHECSWQQHCFSVCTARVPTMTSMQTKVISLLLECFWPSSKWWIHKAMDFLKKIKL